MMAGESDHCQDWYQSARDMRSSGDGVDLRDVFADERMVGYVSQSIIRLFGQGENVVRPEVVTKNACVEIKSE